MPPRRCNRPDAASWPRDGAPGCRTRTRRARRVRVRPRRRPLARRARPPTPPRSLRRAGTSRRSRTAWATVTSPRCASTLTSSTSRGAAPSVPPARPPCRATGWQRGWQRPAAPKRTSRHRRHRPKWSICRQSAPADTGAHRPRLTPLLSGPGWDYACSVHVGRREQAMKDVTVTVENRPGRLADFGDATGTAGINIEGACGTTEAARASSTSWWRTRPPRAPP
jgi:hypothetical protein